MPDTLQQFGDRIKSKYPDYAGVDSVELANKMLAKYPEYKDQVATTDSTPNPSMLERFSAGFMGKDIPQPKGLDRGDIAQFAGSSGLETLGGTIMAPGGPAAIALGAGAGKALHEGIRKTIGAFNPGSTDMGSDFQTIKDVGQEAALQGLGAKYIPGAVNMIGKGLSKTASFVGEGAGKLADRTINSLIKPKMVDFVYGKNPGKAVADEGITALSLEDLVPKISAKLQEVGKMYEPLIAQSKGAVIDLSNSIKPIDDAISQVSNYPSVNKEIITRLGEIKNDLMQNLVNKDTTGNWGLTPESAIALKREIGDITKFTGNHSDDATVNKALKQVYHNIDAKLDDAIPGIQAINERYANLLGAKTAAKWRSALISRQDMTHLPELATGVGAGLITGQPLTGIGAAMVHKALGSTPVKTMGAQVFKGIGNKLEQSAIPLSNISIPRYATPAMVSSTEQLMRKHYEAQK